MVVFLCGTYIDLAAEREAVLEAIQEVQQDRQAMEFFGARPDRAIETCLEEVRASDIVIVLIGFLYGSLAPGSEISFTQAEYEEAHRLGKTCLVYVRDENALIPAKYMERDPVKLRHLDSFRNLVESRHTVAKFREGADLARQVASDLSRLIDKDRRPEPPEVAASQNVQALMERELTVAADIQRQLLPTAPLRGEGFEIAGVSVPCRTVGGDYYDFFPYSEGGVAMVIADVSGKSIPAALVMTSLQARVRILSEYGHDPAEFVSRLNRSMCVNMPANRFVTLIFALLKPVEGDVIYCNAGHNPGMVARRDGTVERLSVSGAPLGLLNVMQYQGDTVHLDHGEVLLLYTDGIAECMNRAFEEFGEDRLAAVLRANRDSTAEEIGNAIVNATKGWSDGQPLADDIAIVAGRRL
jgi:hypothetical protein